MISFNQQLMKTQNKIMKKSLLWVCNSSQPKKRKGYLLILFFWDAWEVTLIEQIGHVLAKRRILTQRIQREYLCELGHNKYTHIIYIYEKSN